jgi:hypothetical protein
MGTSLVIRSFPMNPARIQEIIETARCKPANCWTGLRRRHGQIVYPKNGDPLFLADAVAKGAIMFKRLAAGQRIFPSEPAATSLPRPVPEGQAAPSTTAGSAYLDNDDAPHEGEQPLMLSASRSNPLAVPSFAKAGFLFRRLSIKR